MSDSSRERKPCKEVVADELRKQADLLRNMDCHSSHQSGLEIAADHLEREANLQMMIKPRRRP